MAVGNQEQGQYYSIFDGKICRRVKEPTKTSITRINKTGKQVHEEFFGYIDGVIVSINIKPPPADHPEYGKSWVIGLEDGGEMQYLQLNYSGQTTTAFLKMLPNCDLDEKVKIIPNMKLVDGKPKYGLFITQDGTPLKHYWTKDNPGDLPQMEQKTIKGQKVWDDYEQMQFLEAFVKKDIVPFLKRAAAPVPTGWASGSNEDEPLEPNSETRDDLPF